MPSTYAHYAFGQAVLEKMPPAQKEIIQKHRDLYDIGLHGPDILFYYHPLKKNPISALGYAMHEQKGRLFFESAIKILQTKKVPDSHLSYLYGFLCHFALDAKCHPYVEKYVRTNHLSHTTIEVNFDRYLLENKGINPLKYHLSQHIQPSMKAGEIISPYFPQTTPQNIYTALRLMDFYHRLLHASFDSKRQILYLGIDLTKHSEFKDQVMTKKAHPQCELSNHHLNHLMHEAIYDACDFIYIFDQAIKNGNPLPVDFDHTFGED